MLLLSIFVFFSWLGKKKLRRKLKIISSGYSSNNNIHYRVNGQMINVENRTTGVQMLNISKLPSYDEVTKLPRRKSSLPDYDSTKNSIAI